LAAGPQPSHVRRHRTPPRSLAAFFRLVTTSLLFLCGGALVAVSFEGALRLVFGVAGFAGYVLFFARALRELVLPRVLIEGGPRPGGEVQKGSFPRKTGEADGNHVLAAAVLAAVFTLVESPSLAQEPAPETTTAPSPAGPGVQLHGFVDVYAAWNPNQPSDRDSFQPGTGTTAQKANEFGLNLSALDLSLDANPVGFHVVGVAGTGTDVVHASELHPNNVRYVYQASVSYRLRVGRGVLFELGIQPSHIGYESFFSKDNWNYTRGWMGEFSPYYQTGLKVATSFDDHWSGQLWLLNGWQSVEDNNGGKSFGTQVAYAKDALGVTVNTFFGPELNDDSSHWRSFVDFVGTLKISSNVLLATSLDLGEQRRPALPPARWEGVSLWVRTLLSSSSSSFLSLRAEAFHDPDAAVSPLPQTLFGTTLTFETRPHQQLVLKLEGRYDRSTADGFGGPDGPLTKRDQFLFVLGAVATF
jgi:hypothetical protein